MLMVMVLGDEWDYGGAENHRVAGTQSTGTSPTVLQYTYVQQILIYREIARSTPTVYGVVYHNILKLNNLSSSLQ